MMRFDARKLRLNARQADTEDLLDRATVFREGMEPEALDLIEAELRARGVTPEQIEAHARDRQDQVIWLTDGTAAVCSSCHRPAVTEGRAWHRLWGVLPLFRRRYFCCDLHLRQAPASR